MANAGAGQSGTIRKEFLIATNKKSRRRRGRGTNELLTTHGSLCIYAGPNNRCDIILTLNLRCRLSLCGNQRNKVVRRETLFTCRLLLFRRAQFTQRDTLPIITLDERVSRQVVVTNGRHAIDDIHPRKVKMAARYRYAVHIARARSKNPCRRDKIRGAFIIGRSAVERHCKVGLSIRLASRMAFSFKVRNAAAWTLIGVIVGVG